MAVAQCACVPRGMLFKRNGSDAAGCNRVTDVQTGTIPIAPVNQANIGYSTHHSGGSRLCRREVCRARVYLDDAPEYSCKCHRLVHTRHSCVRPIYSIQLCSIPVDGLPPHSVASLRPG